MDPNKAIKGWVPRKDSRGTRLVPWWAADSTRFYKPEDYERIPPDKREVLRRREARDNAVAAQMVKRLKENLPPIQKRSPQERLKSMTDRLVHQYQATKDVLGYGVLPKEIMDEIAGHYWTEGQPVTREQLEVYAKRLLEEAERRNPSSRPASVR